MVSCVRPAASGGDQPDIVASADVGDEGDLLTVGRPGGSADVASGVELLDGEVLHVLDGLALEIGGVGEGVLRKCWRNQEKQEKTHTSKERLCGAPGTHPVAKGGRQGRGTLRRTHPAKGRQYGASGFPPPYRPKTAVEQGSRRGTPPPPYFCKILQTKELRGIVCAKS